MGCKVAWTEMDAKANGALVTSNGSTREKIHVALKVSPDLVDNEGKGSTTADSSAGNKRSNFRAAFEKFEKKKLEPEKSTNKKHTVSPAVKSRTPRKAGAEETVSRQLATKTEKHEVLNYPETSNNSEDSLTLKSRTPGKGDPEQTVPQQFTMATEKSEVPDSSEHLNNNEDSPALKSHTPGKTGAEQNVPQQFAIATEMGEVLNSAEDLNNSEVPPSELKNIQLESPLTGRKLLQFNINKYYDEEDAWSMTSSTAASVRTCKSVTVGRAPTFKSADRAARRKEFYTKLAEKHKALEIEQSQAEARSKEEQEAALKQLRKSMSYKANPVPSFYYEPPPPKPEPEKLPLTRPKSPNLNRRKSCTDAVRTCPEEVGKHCTRHRHSTGSYKADSTVANSTKSKAQISTPTSNSTGKIRARTRLGLVTENSARNKITGEANADISVH